MTDPQRLKVSIAMGDARRTTHRQPLDRYDVPLPAGIGGHIEFQGQAFTPAFRSERWKHSWRCNPFGCTSILDIEVYWIDDADGSIIAWDAVEVGVWASDQRVTEDNIGSREFYRHFDNLDRVSIRWEKDGHDPDFNVGFKLWRNGTWWFWQAWSHA
jgi:hypothetical protein